MDFKPEYHVELYNVFADYCKYYIGYYPKPFKPYVNITQHFFPSDELFRQFDDDEMAYAFLSKHSYIKTEATIFFLTRAEPYFSKFNNQEFTNLLR